MTFSNNPRPPRKPTAAAAAAPHKGKKRVATKPVRKPSDRAAVPNIENTGREMAYLDKLVRNETVVAVVMNSGETLRGCVRYYDRDVFSLRPVDGGPKLFLRKENIRYLYEENE